MTTFLTIATRALDSDFPATRQPDASRFVRDAVQKVYRRVTLPEGNLGYSTNLGAGASTLNLDDPVAVALRGIIGDDGYPLEQISLAEMQQYQLTSPQQGRPQLYTVTGGTFAGGNPDRRTVTFWPTADRIYAMFFVGWQTPSAANSADGSTVPLPECYERILVSFTRSELFALEDDFQSSDWWLAHGNAQLAELASDQQRDIQRPRRTPGYASRRNSGVPVFHRPGLF